MKKCIITIHKYICIYLFVYIKYYINAHITKIRDRIINTLTDLYLDGDFDKKEFEDKRSELMKNRDDLTLEIQKYDRADDNFTTSLSRLVELVSRAVDVFKTKAGYNASTV